MVATPDPTTGTVLSTTAWGHDVYLDLRRLSNLTIMAALGTASLSSGSTTYVDVTGASTSWTKLGGSTDTDVYVLLTVSSLASVASTTVTWGINIGGTDTDVAPFGFNPANTHLTAVGFQKVAGVAVGGYTPNVRFKRRAGTGTVTINVDDTVAFLIAEVPK